MSGKQPDIELLAGVKSRLDAGEVERLTRCRRRLAVAEIGIKEIHDSLKRYRAKQDLERMLPYQESRAARMREELVQYVWLLNHKYGKGERS